MKRNVLISMLMLVLGWTGICEVNASQCERLEDFGLAFDASYVKADLVDGSWDIRVSGAYGTMYFREDGFADYINTYLDGKQIQTFAWSMSMVHEEVRVSIEYPDGKTEQYTLTPTCDGYAVRNVRGKNGTMAKVTSHTRDMLDQARLRLVGQWESATGKKRSQQSSMVWNFAQDGKFRMSMAPDYTHSVLEGIWDLTPDGNNIMLFFTTFGTPESVYAGEILKIHGLDFEDLVLSGDTFERLVQKTTSESEMHFEKVPGI